MRSNRYDTEGRRGSHEIRPNGAGRMNILSKAILVIVLSLIIAAPLASATKHINETAGDFIISFDNSENINMIGKMWDLTTSSGIFGSSNIPNLNIKTVDMVLTGVISSSPSNTANNSNRYAGVMILVLDKPITTLNVMNEMAKNSSTKYMRIYDRTIDSHKGLYVLTGNMPADPNMVFIGVYGLNDDAFGNANELVFIVSSDEARAKTMMDTLHVESISHH